MLAGYLLFTTLLGAKLAGRQATIRDFFLGGRKLPWPAVAGSIIATEISAVTLISVPAVVYAQGGDLTYLQLGIGAILARLIVGVWFVRAFYEREIYSPYDYVGHYLGPPARRVTTALFLLGNVLGQSVRVLLTALILKLITGMPLAAAIWVIGAFAAAWTLLGGITTVIWTDVIQFFVFLLAMLVGLGFVLNAVPGGWSEMVRLAAQAADAAGEPASKLRFWNLSGDPSAAFTLWAALFGNTVLCLYAYGTDQMMSQRMFCCRGPRQASLAIISSSIGQVVAVLAALVGLGLYAFYQHNPLGVDAARLVARDKDNIFPVFILQQLPRGLVGLIIAGVFAAAISSLDSALAALSQTVISAFYKPWRESRQARASARRQKADEEGTRSAAATAADAERHYMAVSKGLVVFWAVALSATAQVSLLAKERYADILNLALAMATYTGGTLLAAFLLTFWRLNVDYRGILWAAPLSVLTVFAVTWHQPWARHTTAVLAGAVLLGWLADAFGSRHNARGRAVDVLGRSALIALAGGLAVFLCWYEPSPGRHLTVAWPWNVPIGFVVAFTLGYLLARPRTASAQLR